MLELFLEDIKEVFGKTTISKEEKDVTQVGEGYTEEYIRDLSISNFDRYQGSIYTTDRTEKERIRNYREMSFHPEIGDVLEEICDEGSRVDEDGNVIQISFTSPKWQGSNQKVKNIQDEFYDLFYNRIEITSLIWDFFWTFLVDGRLFLENIIDPDDEGKGIIGLKKLPSRTMDFIFDARSNKILQYMQIVKTGRKAEKIPFDPAQITFFDYGIYGKNRKVIYGYLEKAKIPYRQLRLLEDSAIIYRLVRAPERFVFKIDVGTMPRNKARTFINELKRNYNRQMSYDPSTGRLRTSSNVLSMLENFWIPTNSEGRGSEVDVLQGGANLGEIEDILYFQRRLYKALKYPVNRVQGDGGGSPFLAEGKAAADITRDEVKFAKFIERIQRKFSKALSRLFLMNLELKSGFNRYGLTKDDFLIEFNPPSDYAEIKWLEMEDLRGGVYNNLVTDETISPTFLKNKYLGWTAEDISDNKKLLKSDMKDKEAMGGEFQPGIGDEKPFGPPASVGGPFKPMGGTRPGAGRPDERESEAKEKPAAEKASDNLDKKTRPE